MEQNLELITGDLRAYNQLVPGTFQGVKQLTEERITNLDLCRFWLYTSDGNPYKSGKGSSVLWGIVPEEWNLILKHLYDKKNSSFEQLVQTGDFIPDEKESDEAFKQAEVFNLARFRLQGNDSTYRFLQIRTKDGFVYNGKKFVPQKEEEKKALNKIGFTELYLNFLADNSVRKIKETRLYVLSSEYVRQKAGTIWRASWLGNFSLNSQFDTDVHNIVDDNCLRGVRRGAVASESEPEGAVGASALQLTLPQHYQAILADPEEAARALDLDTANGLERIISRFRQQKK